MIVVLLFNMAGYNLLLAHFITSADIDANEKISKGFYKPDELVEIKIPVHLPDIQDQPDFQSIAGQVKLQDADYNYVAMKMTRDTMYLMCIPNYEKTRLITENIIIAKAISDSPLNKKNHTSPSKKVGVDTDFSLPVQEIASNTARLALDKATLTDTYMLPVAYLSTPAQPPEA